MNIIDTTTDEVAEEELAFAEEVGSLVFQSALMQFLAEEESDVAEKFEAYVETHVAEENFVDNLCAEYPKFQDLLQQEMAILQAEIKEVVEDSEVS